MTSLIQTTETGEILIDPMVVEADPDQPRREFDPMALRELMESIAAIGLIEPLVVNMLEGGKFRLVAGERRMRACRMGRKEFPENLHFHRVPVRIRQTDAWAGLARIRAQLDENRIREGLQPGEIAVTYRNAKLLLEVKTAEMMLVEKGLLPSKYAMTAPPVERQRTLKSALRKPGIAWPVAPWTEVFKSLGQPVDRRVLAILRISSPVLQRCDEIGLTKTAVATISALKDESKQISVLDMVVKYNDKGLLAPLVDLLNTDPSMSTADALKSVLQSRQVVKEAKETAAIMQSVQKETHTEPTVTTATSEEYDQAVAQIRALLGTLEFLSFTKYQAGSLGLLLDRSRQALHVKK